MIVQRANKDIVEIFGYAPHNTTNECSSLWRLGGCPFAPGASGNTASEDLIYLLDQLGVETGVDFAQLLAAAKYQRERVPGSYSGHHININAPQCVLG